MGALARPRRRSARRSLGTGAGSVALAAAKQFTPRSVEVSAFASLRKNFLRVATAMQEAGMQHGSLIRSGRKRGLDVWQFRWADRGPYGKGIYRKRVIGTVCQYPDQDSARQSVTVLLREINRHALQRCSLPMTVAEVCDHFVQRELTKDNIWRSYSTKRAYKAYLTRWIIPHWGSVLLSEVRPTDVHSKQRGSEGGTGAPTSCEQSHHAGSLRSGGNAEQTAGTKQTGSDGAQQGRSTGL